MKCFDNPIERFWKDYVFMIIRSGNYTRNIGVKMNSYKTHATFLDVSSRISQIMKPIALQKLDFLKPAINIPAKKTFVPKPILLFTPVVQRTLDTPRPQNIADSDAIKISGVTDIAAAIKRFSLTRNLPALRGVIKEHAQQLSDAGFNVKGHLRALRARIIQQGIDKLIDDKEYDEAFAMIQEKEFVMRAGGISYNEIQSAKYAATIGTIQTFCNTYKFARALQIINGRKEIMEFGGQKNAAQIEEIIFHAKVLENSMILADYGKIRSAIRIIRNNKAELLKRDYDIMSIIQTLRARSILSSIRKFAMEGDFESADQKLVLNKKRIVESGFNYAKEKDAIFALGLIYTINELGKIGDSEEALRLIALYSHALASQGFQIIQTDKGIAIIPPPQD